MRQLLSGFSALVALGVMISGAMAGYDPPRQHYSTSRLLPDPGLKKAMPASHFRGFLRVSIDLSKKMPPVGDQGKLGAGFAWAVAYAARSYYAGEREGRNVDSPRNEASPNYVYNVASGGDCADGVTLSSTVDVLRRGALSLAAYPYNTNCSEPARQLMAAANDFRITGYRVLDRSEIDDIKGQLERGNPVIVPFLVSPAFEAFRGNGIFAEKDFTQSGEDQWQALTIVGYDDVRQAVHVMNSWGRGWGDNGYAWIAYPALTARISSAIVLQTAPALQLPVAPTLSTPAAPPVGIPVAKAQAEPAPPASPPPAAKRQSPSASAPPAKPVVKQAAVPAAPIPAPTPTLPTLPTPVASRHGLSHTPHETQADANPAVLVPQELTSPVSPPSQPPIPKPQTPAPAAKTVTPEVAEVESPAAKSQHQPTLADLHDLACGKIKESRTDGETVLNGFVATAEDLARVKAVVAAEKAQGRHYALGEVKLAPWPLCEALDTLDKALVAPIRPTLTTQPSGSAKAGDLLRIALQSPNRPSYLYLSYFQADQTVITLAQPDRLALDETPAHRELIFGDGKDGRGKFTVGAPFGTEMLVALASASPLFAGQLPKQQSEREYLSMLRKALIYKPVANLPDRVVGAAIRILKTRAD